MLREYQQDIGIDLSFDGFEGTVEKLLNRYIYPNGLFFFVKSNDLILGIVGVFFLKNKECEIKRLYVRRRWRRLGIARRMIQRAIRTVQALGYRKIRLICLKRLAAATALYSSLGFKQVDNGAVKKELYPYSDLISFEIDIDTEEVNK